MGGVSGYQRPNEDGAFRQGAPEADFGVADLQQAGAARLQHAEFAAVHESQFGKAGDKAWAAGHFRNLCPFTGLQQIQRDVHGRSSRASC